MTVAERIRDMEDDELAEFLVCDVPDECDGCKDSYARCIYECSKEKHIERMLVRLQEEAE